MMPIFLSKYEMYIDIRIMTWGQTLEELSTTALQALSCGCKVYHNDKVIEKFPAEHSPQNVLSKLNSFYEEILKKQVQQPEDKLDLNQMKCLYIEDQVDSQILFKVQMKGLKDIKYAVSFEEALPLLDTEQFDFIVMDINLQGEYNGLDALKIIHKMQGYEDIPIIAVTAYVLPGDKEKFIASGFNDFIAKPIFREKMIESLEKIFLQKV